MKLALWRGWRSRERKHSWKTLLGIVVLACSLILLVALLWIRYSRSLSYSDEESVVSVRSGRLNNAERNLQYYFQTIRIIARLYNLQMLDSAELWDPRTDPEWANGVRKISWSMLSTIPSIGRLGVIWDKGSVSYVRVNHAASISQVASGTAFLELGVLNETTYKIDVSYWEVPLSNSWQHCPAAACDGFIPPDLVPYVDPPRGLPTEAPMFLGAAGCSYSTYVVATSAARLSKSGVVETVPSPPVRNKSLTTCLLPSPKGELALENFFSLPWVQAMLAQDTKLSFTLNLDGGGYRLVHIYASSALTISRANMTPFRMVAGVSFSTSSLGELLTSLDLMDEGIFVMTAKGAILVATSFNLNITSLLPAVNASNALVAAASHHIVSKYSVAGTIVTERSSSNAASPNGLHLEQLHLNGARYFVDFSVVDFGMAVVVVVVSPAFSLQSQDSSQFTVLVSLTAAVFTAAVVLLCVLRASLLRERRHKGALLVAKERAETTSTMTSKFVAHEMSAPLLALRNLTDLLLEECLSHKPLLASKYTSMARASIAPLQQLQSDMQDFDSILSGHMRLQVGVVDLEDVFESTVAMIQMNKSPYVELVLDISESCPRFVLGDAGRIKQVLTTVLSNSMRCTQRGNVMVRLTCGRAPGGAKGQGHGKGDDVVASQPSQSTTLHGPAALSIFFPPPLQMHRLWPHTLDEGMDGDDGDVMEALSLHTHGASAYLSCLVCDTGPEISEPEAIFDVAAAVDGGKRPRDDGGGTSELRPLPQLHRGGGLSFVVARSIARMMGGDLKVVPNPRGGMGAKIQFDMLLLVAEEQQYSWQSASALASRHLWDSPMGGGKSSHCARLAEEPVTDDNEEGPHVHALRSTNSSEAAPPPTPVSLGAPVTPPRFKPSADAGSTSATAQDGRLRRPEEEAYGAGVRWGGGETTSSSGFCEAGSVLLCLSGALESHTVERWFSRKGYRVLKARNLQHACALLGHPLEQLPAVPPPPARPQVPDSVYYSPAAASRATRAAAAREAATGGGGMGAVAMGGAGGLGAQGSGDVPPSSNVSAPPRHRLARSANDLNFVAEPRAPPAEEQVLMTIVDSDFLLSSVLFSANLMQQVSASSRDAGGPSNGVPKPGRRRAMSCGNVSRASGSFSGVDAGTQSELGDSMLALLERLPLCCCVAWVLSGNAASSRAVENEIKEGHRLASMVAGLHPTEYMMIDAGYCAAAWSRFRMAVVRAPIHTWRLKSLLASARAGDGEGPPSADAAGVTDDSMHGWSERAFRFAAEWQGSSPSVGSEPKMFEEVAFGMGKPPLTPAPEVQAWFAAGAKQVRDAARHQPFPMTLPDQPFPRTPPHLLDSPVKLAGIGQATQINYSELQLLEKIGEGTFGEVFRGKWFGKEVAIKRMRTSTLTGSMLEEFHKEVGILESIRHPNCVLYMGFCLQPQLCIVTEFIAGGNLAQRLRLWRQQHGGRPLDMQVLLKVARDVCLGIMFLHFRKQHMMHRDLKSNVRRRQCVEQGGGVGHGMGSHVQ
eukprot:jgi/Mesvir1/12421/Mv00589-RA.2